MVQFLLLRCGLAGFFVLERGLRVPAGAGRTGPAARLPACRYQRSPLRRLQSATRAARVALDPGLLDLVRPPRVSGSLGARFGDRCHSGYRDPDGDDGATLV